MSSPATHPSEKALRRMFAAAITHGRGAGTPEAISQETLAELTGLSTSYISLLERGQRNLTVWAATRIAAACGLRLSEFVALAESKGAK